MTTTLAPRAIAAASGPSPRRESIGITHYLHMVTAEYREMPGLSLTARQMQRLWSLEQSVCDALIEALVEARILRRTQSGTFVLFS